MNLGGEPERDDFGLPPVDIEIPDDARELDRDAQAYRRELRAQRRRLRRMRLHGPLTRDGVVLPLLASCLVLALIAGTLLTVFTAGPGGELPRPARSAGGQAGPTGGAAVQPPSAGSASGPADSPSATASGIQLPDGTVRIGGLAASLQSLRRSVVALIPATCHCTPLVQRLEGQARAAGVPYYLVGGGLLASARALQAQAPQRAIVTDSASILVHKYEPILESGPMALLVQPDGSVTEINPLPAGFRLDNQLHDLAVAPASGSASPSAGGSALPSTSAPAR
ncbi:MAG TPA: hypothetical protein VGG35_17910 [Streptosporangiaceae bacterium]